MHDLQRHFWRVERAGAREPVPSAPRHPLAVGALCVAVAVGAWYGLLWRFGQAGGVGVTVPGRAAPAPDAETLTGGRTRSMVVAPATPSSSPARAPAGHSSSPPPVTSKASADSAPKALSDSARRPKLSPFRRSHPWVAPAGGRYYYPSGCPAALDLPDLVFFRSEAEARNSGFIPSSLPGCE